MQRIVIIATIAVTTILLTPWTAIELEAGMIDLDDAALAYETNQTSANPRVNPAETFYFTLTLPTRTEAGFSKLSFSPDPAQILNTVQFDLATPTTFLGTPAARGRSIDTEAWIDETGTVWVEFNAPIAAGTVLTVALNRRWAMPDRGPSAAGTSREYGIAAYPATQNPVAVFVGDQTLIVR